MASMVSSAVAVCGGGGGGGGEDVVCLLWSMNGVGSSRSWKLVRREGGREGK